jgi:uncharacterized membrane protein YbhN (UPF0104 family)
MAPAPRRSVLRVLRAIALVAGVIAFVFTACRLGWSGLTHALATTGAWFIVIAAIDVAGAMCDAGAICALASSRDRLPYGRAVAAQLSGVAINRVTPGNALGEPVKISILVERIPRDTAVSTILMFDAGATLIAVFAIVIGIPITLLFADVTANVATAAWIGAGVLVAFLIGLYVLIRRGPVTIAIRVLRALHIITAERATAWFKSVAPIDDMVRELGTTRSSRLGLLGLFGSRFLNWVGTLVMLYAAGLPVTVPLVIGIFSLGALITWISHMVPLGLGLAEGGNYLMYRAFGYSGVTGLDFTMVYRARTVLLSAIGFAVLAMTSYQDRRRRATVIE